MNREEWKKENSNSIENAFFSLITLYYEFLFFRTSIILVIIIFDELTLLEFIIILFSN